MSGLPNALTSDQYCVGCGQVARRMPLCPECAVVWDNDRDSWTYKDADSDAIRARANQWLREHGDRA